ncbi:DUF6647 family protein [Azohydromonas aeria]|uniref:DUF6647 family protein n=1 Tax=Azohydromonas aeria TaxID=2590212 RepID=UPI0012FADD83|nr:hypothetical protein [Azohydromonas aeria]
MNHPPALTPPPRRQRLTSLLLGLAGLLAPALAGAGDTAGHRPALAATAPAAAAKAKAPHPHRHAVIDAALAADLLGWASRLSGLPIPPGEPLPKLIPMSQREIAKTVCGPQHGGCAGLVAVYDTDRRRILYRDTLDMRDPTDQSFIVHELVHHLQFLQRGEALFATCQSTLAGEAQAYRAQNLYQAQFRQWQRMGEVLRYMHCDGVTGSEPVARLFGVPGR